MRLYQIWLGTRSEYRTMVFSFQAEPGRAVWDQFTQYRAMINAPWVAGLRLVPGGYWFPDTPIGWPDATFFLNQCFEARRRIESFEEDLQAMQRHWKSYKRPDWLSIHYGGKAT